MCVCVWTKVFDDCNCNRNELLQLRKRRLEPQKLETKNENSRENPHNAHNATTSTTTCDLRASDAEPMRTNAIANCDEQLLLLLCLCSWLLSLGSCSAQQLCLRSVLPVDCLNMYSSDEYVIFVLSCMYA